MSNDKEIRRAHIEKFYTLLEGCGYRCLKEIKDNYQTTGPTYVKFYWGPKGMILIHTGPTVFDVYVQNSQSNLWAESYADFEKYLKGE